MKYYDYNKAKRIIESTIGLKSASLGMREDWFWTAKTVWEDGEWKEALFYGDVEAHHKAYIDKLREALTPLTDGLERLAAREQTSKNFGQHELCGLCGSSWATPVLGLTYADEREEHVLCFIGESDKDAHVPTMLGCLSGPAQDRVEEIEIVSKP